MIYVLDSNVAVEWVLTEVLSDKAQLVRDDFKNGLHELLSPDIFPAEVIHALARAERQNRITPPEGGKLFAEVMATAPRLSPYQPLIPRAYEIASQALSEIEKCQLLTAEGADRSGLGSQASLARARHTLPIERVQLCRTSTR
jgi:predicted nucleic acid-binding protein